MVEPAAESYRYHSQGFDMTGALQPFGGRRMLRSSHAIAGALVIVAAACSQSNPITIAHTPTPLVRDSIIVTVINDHFYEARVHAVYGQGLRYPLGVMGMKRENGPFTIPWHIEELAFEIDMITISGRYVSDEIPVQPGDLVELRIPPNISSSAFFTAIRQE
ncbi:MAG: hypothetical protein AMS18_03245 [Gemmatimonas sp. SG8_17]|nr:MAG: hypothetical protein AMS18_03245 [Gemmatimonas sp. SG8_17]